MIKTLLKAVAWFVLALVVVTAAAAFAVRQKPTSPAAERLAKILPIPAATVYGRPLWLSDVQARARAAEESGRPSTSAAALKAAVRGAVIDRLGAEHGLTVSRAELKNAAAAGVPEAAARQALLTEQLLSWYYQQRDLNGQTYRRADTIVERLKKGERLDALAQTYSQDEASKQFGGSAGSFRDGELLPELAAQISGSKPGDVKVVGTRYGVHVIRVSGANGSASNIDQIFLGGEGFPAWLAAQVQAAPVRVFIRAND